MQALRLEPGGNTRHLLVEFTVTKAIFGLVLGAKKNGCLIVLTTQQVFSEVEASIGEPLRALDLLTTDQDAFALAADNPAEIPELGPERLLLIQRPLVERVIVVYRQILITVHLNHELCHVGRIDAGLTGRPKRLVSVHMATCDPHAAGISLQLRNHNKILACAGTTYRARGLHGYRVEVMRSSPDTSQ